MKNSTFISVPAFFIIRIRPLRFSSPHLFQTASIGIAAYHWKFHKFPWGFRFDCFNGFFFNFVFPLFSVIGLLGSGCCERSAFGNEMTSIADVIPVTSKCLNFYHCRCGSAAAAAAAAMINHHLCAGFAIHWLILVCHSHSTSAAMLKFWYQKPLEKSGVIRRSANGERI